MGLNDSNAAGMTVERRSDRELVVTRRVNGPPALVFRTWAEPELFHAVVGPGLFRSDDYLL
jgi:uncharacterized protein YndB with AHSA1/START domain